MFQPQRIARRQLALSVGLVLVAVLLDGCGGNRATDRTIVSGTVTYKGKPISEGRIQFSPVDGCQAPSTAANIVDGRYKADLHGGVPVGTFSVAIEAYDKAPTPRNPMWIPKNYLPTRFGANSQLRITIEPSSRDVTKNVDLND